MERPVPSRRLTAFTIVELMVVIAVIAILVALILPSFRPARENARRSRCAGDIRQTIIGLTTLADNASGVLPSGKRNIVGGTAVEHCIWISDQLHDDLIALNGGVNILECLNFTDGFGYNNQYGWVIGYNYLGNHPRMNELGYFKSPIRITENPNLPVWTDLLNWTPSAVSGWSFAAHTSFGAANNGVGPRYYNINPAGPGYHPADIGGKGGNVGLLDTSVHWRPIDEMTAYETGEWGINVYSCLW